MSERGIIERIEKIRELVKNGRFRFPRKKIMQTEIREEGSISKKLIRRAILEGNIEPIIWDATYPEGGTIRPKKGYIAEYITDEGDLIVEFKYHPREFVIIKSAYWAIEEEELGELEEEELEALEEELEELEEEEEIEVFPPHTIEQFVKVLSDQFERLVSQKRFSKAKMVPLSIIQPTIIKELEQLELNKDLVNEYIIETHEVAGLELVPKSVKEASGKEKEVGIPTDDKDYIYTHLRRKPTEEEVEEKEEVEELEEEELEALKEEELEEVDEEELERIKKEIEKEIKEEKKKKTKKRA